MPTYIRFDENGVQVEVNTKPSKPAGEEWENAPGDFDSTKRYRRDPDDTVREETAAENETLQLVTAKETAISNVRRVLNGYRDTYAGYSNGKSKGYETQARSAERVLAAVAASQPIDALDNQILGELATVRSITVEAMANLIKAEMDAKDIALGALEACEDKADDIIQNSTTLTDLENDLAAWELDVEATVATL